MSRTTVIGLVPMPEVWPPSKEELKKQLLAMTTLGRMHNSAEAPGAGLREVCSACSGKPSDPTHKKSCCSNTGVFGGPFNKGNASTAMRFQKLHDQISTSFELGSGTLGLSLKSKLAGVSKVKVLRGEVPEPSPFMSEQQIKNLEQATKSPTRGATATSVELDLEKMPEEEALFHEHSDIVIVSWTGQYLSCGEFARSTRSVLELAMKHMVPPNVAFYIVIFTVTR